MVEKESLFRNILIGVISVAITLYSMLQLFGKGQILNWHIHQEAFYRSGIQCIFVIMLVSVLMKMFKNNAMYIYCFFVCLFLLMQGIIVPFLAAYVYFEIICFVGFVFNDRLKHDTGLISNFLAGITVWGFFGIIFSLLKQGTINDLRIMTVAILLICILLRKNQYIFLAEKVKKVINKTLDEKCGVFFVVFLTIFTLAIASKTNMNYDVDSLWYMLKPEHMLVGKNSFYDYLGYSAFVFYYPKLVEFFFLPISALGDYSFILIGNVLVYIFLTIVIYKIVDYMCPKYSMTLKLLFVSVMVTVPSLVSVVPSVKGDAFGSLFVFIAIYFFLQYIEKKQFEYIVGAFLALLYCTGTKLTFLLWGGIVGICMLIYFVVDIVRNKESKCTKPKLNELFKLFIGMFFVFGIHLRTFLLTGYPIYPLLIDFWKKIGFTGKPFMKQASNIEQIITKEEYADRVYQFVFDPSDMPHTIMCWPTNIVLIIILMTIIMLIGKKLKVNSQIKLLLCISVIELAFAIYFLLTKAQPDGNYFYFPFTIVCMTCFCFMYYQHECKIIQVSKISLVCSLCFMMVMTTCLSFVTNWSWSLGIEPFTYELIGDNFSDYKEDDEYFKEKGIYKIAKYIEEVIPKHRIIISGNESNIKGSVENTWSLFDTKWSDGATTESYENFIEYVEYADIVGFIIYEQEESTFKDYTLRYVSEHGGAQVVEDEKAVLYIVP